MGHGQLSRASISAGHNLFSGTHLDVSGTPARGDIVVRNSSGLWVPLPIGASGTFLRSNGLDPSYSQILAADIEHELISAAHSDSDGTPAQGGLLVRNAAGKWVPLPIGASGRFLRSDGSDPGYQEIQETDIADGSVLARLAADETVSGTYSFTPGIKERGRSVAVGEWEAFTPTWTGTSSNPAIGDGSLNGRYTRVGKTVYFWITLTPGAATTFGSGRWDLTVPTTRFGVLAGTVLMLESGVGTHGGGVQAVSATAFTVFDIVTKALLSPTTPFTWAAGDTLQISGHYEET